MPTNLPKRRRPSPGHPPAPGAFERWFLVVFVAAFLGILAVDVARDYSPLKLSILFFVVARLLLVGVHEAGHALAAAALGWRVRRVVIGLGKAALRWTVRGVPVRIARFPIGGYVALKPRHLRQVRVRSALIYFAGPGAELAVLAVIVALVGFGTLTTRHVDPWIVAAQAASAAIVLDVVTNLIPIAFAARMDPRAPLQVTDGLGMIMSFVWPRSVFEQQLAAPDDDGKPDDDDRDEY